MRLGNKQLVSVTAFETHLGILGGWCRPNIRISGRFLQYMLINFMTKERYSLIMRKLEICSDSKNISAFQKYMLMLNNDIEKYLNFSFIFVIALALH